MDRNEPLPGNSHGNRQGGLTDPNGNGHGHGADPADDPKSLEPRKGGVMKYLGRAISLAVLVAVVLQLRQLDFSKVWSVVPTSPLFWITFVVYYMLGSVTDWVIFRKLWRIPVSGILPLLRKQIGNALLFGYVGELYFYDWARKRADITNSPFGAVKDVAILSAVMGNVVTLLSVLLAWPLVTQTTMGIPANVIWYSVAFLVGSTAVILLFGRRLFSLPKADLWYISAVHMVRIVFGLVLTGLCWHLALPDIALVWWVVLSVTSMLVGRLPFVSNKDFVFAALAVFLIGHDAEIPALMTMMASLILATHVGLGLVLMLSDVILSDKRQ
jgi:hypothetical protein